jgi:hypothetical protein
VARRTVFSTASVHHARLRRDCGIFRSPSVSPHRCDLSRGRGPEGDARVFRPCSRGTDSSRDLWSPGSAGFPGVGGSLRPSAGGANEETAPRTHAVTLWRCSAVSSLPRFVTEPGPQPPESGFSAFKCKIPCAFHEHNQAARAAWRSRLRVNRFADITIEGPLRSCDRPMPGPEHETLSRPEHQPI